MNLSLYVIVLCMMFTGSHAGDNLCCNTGQTIAFSIFALLIVVVIIGMVLYHLRSGRRRFYPNQLINVEYGTI